MNREQILNRLEILINTLDGASGRLIVTAMSGNKEVMEAMNMISETSIELGSIAETIEELK